MTEIAATVAAVVTTIAVVWDRIDKIQGRDACKCKCKCCKEGDD